MSRLPRRSGFAGCLMLAIAVAGCVSPAPGVVRVWINRTETAIEVQEGIIAPCSTRTFTQADIDAAAELRRMGRFPAAPPGTVDLTTQGYSVDGNTRLPLIIVELADGNEQYFFVSVDEAQLPECVGRAAIKAYGDGPSPHVTSPDAD